MSREVDPNKMILVTCGSIHGGDAPNVIPDKAVLKVDVRSYDLHALEKATTAIHRIVEAECRSSGAEKSIIE